MELRLNNLDYIDNVLNRSKFIIDEYNDKLVNENEYAHINIIRDIDKSLIKLNEIKNEYDVLNLFIKNFNNQNLIQLEYYITNHTNVENISKIKSILDIPLLSNYSITILTKNDVFNGSCYIIRLEKKNENN